MRISDWSSDVCSSDLSVGDGMRRGHSAEIAREANLVEITDRLVAEEQHLVLQQLLAKLGDGCIVKFLAKVDAGDLRADDGRHRAERSEEHPSELQSLMRNSYAVFCLNKKINSTTCDYRASTK